MYTHEEAAIPLRKSLKESALNIVSWFFLTIGGILITIMAFTALVGAGAAVAFTAIYLMVNLRDVLGAPASFFLMVGVSFFTFFYKEGMDEGWKQNFVRFSVWVLYLCTFIAAILWFVMVSTNLGSIHW